MSDIIISCLFLFLISSDDNLFEYISSFLAHIIPGILLFSLRFVGENPMYCVALITIALGLNGASTVVSLANALDLAPNYGAFTSAFINTFATMAGIIAPMVVSYFTSENVGFGLIPNRFRFQLSLFR